MELNCFLPKQHCHAVATVVVASQQPDRNLLPVIMIHGGFHTGEAYLATPDGRPGWAYLFAQRGHKVLVPDWPAHGRSAEQDGIVKLRTLDVARALGELVRSTGKCILIAHSAGGPAAWWLAEHFPDQVAAIIGVAPGSPANILPELPDDPVALHALRHDASAGFPVFSPPSKPAVVDVDFIQKFWAQGPRFPHEHLEKYAASIVPESPRILNERFNIGGAGLKIQATGVVSNRPILIVTGECDHRHPKATDGALAAFLQADFYWLPDFGVHDNGHMLMLEDNSDAIAALLMQWLQSHGL